MRLCLTGWRWFCASAPQPSAALKQASVSGSSLATALGGLTGQPFRSAEIFPGPALHERLHERPVDDAPARQHIVPGNKTANRVSETSPESRAHAGDDPLARSGYQVQKEHATRNPQPMLQTDDSRGGETLRRRPSFHTHPNPHRMRARLNAMSNEQRKLPITWSPSSRVAF
jgi:hypothetical protein